MGEVFIPPQNLDAERAVLGGVLIDNRTVADLPPELTPSAFYVPSHRAIFRAMLDLWQREEPVDIISVAHRAKALGEDVSIASLAEIFEQGMPQSITYYAGLVIDAFQQRRAVDRLRAALREVEENPAQHDEILSRLFFETDKALPCEAVPIPTVMVEALKRIEKAGRDRVNVPTGFDKLDKSTGGFERNDLVIVAGRPGMGKTSLALDFGVNAAVRGYSVFIVSVETSRDKLGMRMLSRETQINSWKFRKGALGDADYPRLAKAAGELSGLPIDVLDRQSDWDAVRRSVQRRARRGLDLVILDYLTLLDLPSGRQERRDVAVGRIVNQAKQLALQLNLVFILLAQLNRQAEGRADPEPVLSDLRDSGEIEQAADLVIFPFRPIVYDEEYKPRNKAFLKIAKARDLPTGKIPVKFNAEFTSFSDWKEDV